MRGTRSKSGVFVFDDFRDNLIIDRYDPVLATIRGSKIEHLRSENSEDALTWNIFRSLRQVDPTFWVPRLFTCAFHTGCEPPPAAMDMWLWPSVCPPPSLRLFQKDEGPSEIDVVLESESLVWFIEAKYRHDVSTHTTNNPARDQILRPIDVGSWYAGRRDFYFSLLVLNEKSTRDGVSLLSRYLASKDELLSRLPHRRDGLSNLRGIGLLKWIDLAAILSDCSKAAVRENERQTAKRALEWLREKGISPAPTRPKVSETRGHRKMFRWEFESGSDQLFIESDEGIKHEYSLTEIQRILERLNEEFGDGFFPLGNDVAKLGNGTEVAGLGNTILEKFPKDVSHAQGASYLGVVLEECGYLEWNGQRRGIEWRLIRTDLETAAIAARLHNPSPTED